MVSSLSSLSDDLQSWSKDVFGNIIKAKSILLAQITGIQKSLSTNHHQGLIKLEAWLCKELDAMSAQEELNWYRKSRVKWIKNGDCNINFLHISSVVC